MILPLRREEELDLYAGREGWNLCDDSRRATINPKHILDSALCQLMKANDGASEGLIFEDPIGVFDQMHVILDRASEPLRPIYRPDQASPPRSLAHLLASPALQDVELTIPCSLPGFSQGAEFAYRPCWLILAGAFTSGGKTTFCVREAIHKAALGHPVLYATTELSRFEIARKIKATLEPQIEALPIHLWDSSSELGEILKVIEEWAGPLDSGKTPIVVLDYIQRIRFESKQTREREVAIVAEELQRIARRLGIVIVAAAQLNRMSQQEKKPAMHHLRESGLLEQSADLVFLLAKTGSDRLQVTLAKNRWGRSGIEVDLSADFARCTLGELTPEQVSRPIAEAVCKYLRDNDGRAKCREVSQSISIKGRHPVKRDIEEAQRLIGGFSFEGTDVVLAQP